jgi:hypothetical protein
VNIGSSFTYQRPPASPALPRRQLETALSYDKSERRMEHSSFQPNHILMSFWDVVQRLPRQDQISLAANALASQVSQNGLNRESRDFIRSFKNRFQPQDLEAILGAVRQHPLLQKKGAATKDEFLRTIQEILEMPAAIKADDQLAPAPGRPLPRSPEELFFQLSLNSRTPAKKARLEAVSLEN